MYPSFDPQLFDAELEKNAYLDSLDEMYNTGKTDEELEFESLCALIPLEEEEECVL